MRRGPRRVHSLAWRQVRAPTAVAALLVATIVDTGVAAYGSSGGAAGMRGLEALTRNPGVQALYGRAGTLASAGAFMQWKMGQTLLLAVAAWAALMGTRLTRLAEDEGNWDLVVALRPGRRAAWMTGAVLVEAGTVVGAVAAAVLLAGGQARVDSLLFGAEMAGLAWWAGGLGMIAGQLAAPRRAASQWALGAVGLFFLARMVADAGSGLSWLRGLSCFGWAEDLGAFQRVRGGWLVLTGLVGLALVGAALVASTRRDVGAALLVRSDRAKARTGSLAGPGRFAWRERRGTLLTWAAGLALLGLAIGYLTHALVAFASSDPAYVALLDHWGLSQLVTTGGFVGEMAAELSVALCFFAVTLVVVVGTDEGAGRLDLPLATGVARVRWLAAAALATVVALAVVVVVCGVATWVGVLAGGASLSLAGALAAMANAAGPAVAALGIAAVAVVAMRRHAYAALAALTLLAYLAALLGPVLHWPDALVTVSPFHHLAAVPAVGPNWVAQVAFGAIGAAGTVVALAGFARRDLGT